MMSSLRDSRTLRLLSTMSRKGGELEGRLDDLLSRIAMETQEIRELGQQLTNGPVLANEALQTDLQEVICGLQELLRGLRQQARHSQQQVHVLQAENQSLQRLLEDAQRHCRQLKEPQVELSALWTETQALRDRQAELEAELLQLREELSHQQGDQRLQVQLDQSKSRFSQTRTQLERFTAALSELQEDQREPKDKASSELFGTAEEPDGSAQENWNGRQKLQPGRDQHYNWTLHRSRRRTGPLRTDLQEALERNRLQLQELEQERDALLQQLRCLGDSHHGNQAHLDPKLRQLGRSMCGAERLKVDLLQAQRGEDGVEEQGAEPDRTRTRIDGGFVPPGLSAPSLASQGTQDSGLGLQYFSSPDRGRQQEGLPPGGESVSEAGTPPDPTWLRCGPPAGGPAVLLRSIPQHRDMGGRCVSECVHKVEKKKKRRRRRSLRRHRSVLLVCDELQCLEETLLQRRAELRQADRLLLEAQSCRQTARRDARRLQLRLEDGATCLLEATQHLGELQEEAEQLRRKREEEEQRLREVEEKLRRREEELHGAADRLAELLSDCQEAQEHLDSLTSQEQQRLVLMEEEQQNLVQVKAELSSLRTDLKQVLQELLLEQEVLEEVRSRRSQTLQELHRRKEERRRLEEQCRHLEARRSHADRCLSALEAELSKRREELSQAQLFNKEVVRETRANQHQLNSEHQRGGRGGGGDLPVHDWSDISPELQGDVES